MAAPVVPPVEMITVKIDGVAVSVPKTTPDPLTGKPIPTTMIQACNAVKVDVPHYCYHPKLPVAGNCRMCLVEFGTPAMGPDRKPLLNPDGTPKIAKSPRPAIACATPILYEALRVRIPMKGSLMRDIIRNQRGCFITLAPSSRFVPGWLSPIFLFWGRWRQSRISATI